jgi:hypothetical protein
MSNEMVERVARAIALHHDIDGIDSWWKYKAGARAAIAAMREPTNAMLWDAYPEQIHTAKAIWQAMIDEALK